MITDNGGRFSRFRVMCKFYLVVTKESLGIMSISSLSQLLNSSVETLIANTTLLIRIPFERRHQILLTAYQCGFHVMASGATAPRYKTVIGQINGSDIILSMTWDAIGIKDSFTLLCCWDITWSGTEDTVQIRNLTNEYFTSTFKRICLGEEDTLPYCLDYVIERYQIQRHTLSV